MAIVENIADYTLYYRLGNGCLYPNLRNKDRISSPPAQRRVVVVPFHLPMYGQHIFVGRVTMVDKNAIFSPIPLNKEKLYTDFKIYMRFYDGNRLKKLRKLIKFYVYLPFVRVDILCNLEYTLVGVING